MTNEVVKEYIEKSKEIEELEKEKLEKEMELKNISPQLEDAMREVCERLDLEYDVAGTDSDGYFGLILKDNSISVEDLNKLEKSIGLYVDTVESLSNRHISIMFKFE